MDWDNPVKPMDLVAFLHGHNAESNQDWFEKLVQRTLPKKASEILEITNEWNRVSRFIDVFSSTHFPLDDNYMEMVIQWQFQEDPSEFEHGEYGPYAILRQGIPFELTGCTWEAMHDLWDGDRVGTAAMTLLAWMPGVLRNNLWASQEESLKEYLGIRTSWLESAASHIREETLKRIPENGIPMELLKEAVRETPLEAVLLEAKWVYNDTGNAFLDCNPIEEDEFSGFSDPWETEVIETMTKEWEMAKPIKDKMYRLEKWLEKDIDKRFEEMLDFILERLASIPEYSNA